MTLVDIAAFMWIVTNILFFSGVRRWNKRFEALYEELQMLIRGESE